MSQLLPLGPLSLAWRVDGAGPKESPLCPYCHYVGGPKGGGGDITGGASSLRPLGGHYWPLRKLYTPRGTAEGTCGSLPCPSTGTSCQILQVSELEGLWQNVHMWAMQKEYLKLVLSGVSLPSGMPGS